MIASISPMLADAIHVNSGSGFGHDIFVIFIFIMIGLILWAMGRWFFPKLNMPAIGMTVWDGLFVLIAAIVIINFLAGLTGHAFIAW